VPALVLLTEAQDALGIGGADLDPLGLSGLAAFSIPIGSKLNVFIRVIVEKLTA